MQSFVNQLTRAYADAQPHNPMTTSGDDRRSTTDATLAPGHSQAEPTDTPPRAQPLATRAPELLAHLVTLQRGLAAVEAEIVATHADLVDLVAADLADEPSARRHAADAGAAGASRTTRTVRDEAISIVTDEIVTATGLAPWQVQRQARLATAPSEVRGPLVTAMREGRATCQRATTISDRVHGLPTGAAGRVTDRVLAAKRGHDLHDLTPDGLVSHALFRSRLQRAVCAEEAALPDAESRRAERLASRAAHARLGDDGLGVVQVTGAADRVAAAFERVDALARAAKREAGEDRTLPQLRSDVALHLLTHGWDETPGLVGEAPTATVHLRVSLETLVGLATDPGHVAGVGPVPATVAREIATRPGSVWHRIVTDPVTGTLLERTTTTYRPTPSMRADVLARDVTCRAPGCDRPAERCELDHVRPWPGGPTSPANLVALCKHHHQRKTHGRWRHHLTDDGTLVAESRLGQRVTTSPWQDDTPAPTRSASPDDSSATCDGPSPVAPTSDAAIPRPRTDTGTTSPIETHLKRLDAPDLLRHLDRHGPDMPRPRPAPPRADIARPVADLHPVVEVTLGARCRHDPTQEPPRSGSGSGDGSGTGGIDDGPPF